MKTGQGFKWIMIIAGAIVLLAAIQVARHYYRQEELTLRTKLRRVLMDEYPDAVKTIRAYYGLKPFVPSPGLAKSGVSKSTVILVHGLDDPGRVWMNLAPALFEEGFAVWILTYPNDQPVAESARFFLAQLQASDLPATARLAIVAHSMGGLVTREMLTDPALAYGAGVESGRLPRVDQLVMVGTPNHGSELARFRGFTEFRDQLGNLFKDDYHWLWGFVDGTGEAGIDLIPGSEFLRRLNRRPHPAHVRMLVVAGVMGAKQKQEIEALAREMEEKLPETAQRVTINMMDGLIAMAEQVGDGLVSLESARLPGVPLVTVRGTHLSMIRNLTAGSRRMPPAIPVIIEQLDQAALEE